jgi:hypothetical protein
VVSIYTTSFVIYAIYSLHVLKNLLMVLCHSEIRNLHLLYYEPCNVEQTKTIVCSIKDLSAVWGMTVISFTEGLLMQQFSFTQTFPESSRCKRKLVKRALVSLFSFRDLLLSLTAVPICKYI